MDCTVPTDVKQCRQSFYDLAGDDNARKLHLPTKWLTRADACYRNYAFTAASIVSWCRSRNGHSRDPRIPQISARSGLSDKTTKKHIKALEAAGVIERIRRRQAPTLTTITNGFVAWKDKNEYLELPVGMAVVLGAHQVNMIARCVMAALMNRCTLAERLTDNGHGEVDPDDGFTLSAIGRKIGAQRCRVERAADELASVGFPIEISAKWIGFDYNHQLWYPCTHDTRIDYKQWR